MYTGLADHKELLQLASDENDQDLYNEVASELDKLEIELKALEFRRMFSGKMDPNGAFLEIQAGSGGTEAQDWAEMLMRMYMRWGEDKGFNVEVMEVSPGEVAGIKGATLYFGGEYAFGWLRTETGVHRLDMSQVRVDTYRSSGAGGQHVNTTDSAIRLTHLPTGIVVQCQNQRSQHKNKDQAIKQLKAKLYELEEFKRRQEAQAVEAEKADIGWGSQIRSYVLDQSRIKDLRTNVENTNTGAVLDGDLDRFIEASLKMGL
jgi:peptide chain release factor 2